ncbi:HAD family hydrolase [bacterium]|nr:HAD family hydrolase [bacterium]
MPYGPPPGPARVATSAWTYIQNFVILTINNLGTAAAVARTTGVDKVYAELLPPGKVAKVGELVAKYGAVAMVGDGVNDAPAMGRATVAPMSDDLAKLPWLARHSERASHGDPTEHRLCPRREGGVPGADADKRVVHVGRGRGPHGRHAWLWRTRSTC